MNNYSKRSKYLYFTLMLIFVVSCTEDKYVEYTILNASSHDVAAVGISSVTGETSDTIFLTPDYCFSVERWSNGNDGDRRRYFSILYVDSVHLIFDNEKILMLEGCNEDYDCHYLLHPVYTTAAITNDDYDKAIPIE